jgi:hypothetical protein
MRWSGAPVLCQPETSNRTGGATARRRGASSASTFPRLITTIDHPNALSRATRDTKHECDDSDEGNGTVNVGHDVVQQSVLRHLGGRGRRRFRCLRAA